MRFPHHQGGMRNTRAAPRPPGRRPGSGATSAHPNRARSMTATLELNAPLDFRPRHRSAASFHLFTLNTWGFKWPLARDRKRRFQRIAAHLAERDYDVVALQEMWGGAREALGEVVLLGRKHGHLVRLAGADSCQQPPGAKFPQCVIDRGLAGRRPTGRERRHRLSRTAAGFAVPPAWSARDARSRRTRRSTRTVRGNGSTAHRKRRFPGHLHAPVRTPVRGNTPDVGRDSFLPAARRWSLERPGKSADTPGSSPVRSNWKETRDIFLALG